MFGEDLRIDSQFSKHLLTIFAKSGATPTIEGASVREFLFNGADLGTDQISQAMDVLVGSVGCSLLQYEMNASHLPKEFTRESSTESQILQLDWAPLPDENGIIQKIMTTVRDVTEIRKTELAVKANERELQMIGQILALDPTRLENMIQTSHSELTKAKDLLNQSNQGNALESAKSLFRHLHTLKGNARTYGLLEITSKVHEAEQFYADFIASHNGLNRWEPNELIQKINAIETILKDYETLYRTKLNKSQRFDSLSWKQIYDFLNSNRADELKSMAEKNLWVTLPVLLAPILKNMPELAKKLGKETPEVQWTGPMLKILSEKASQAEGIFTHLIGNSLGHGLPHGQPGTIHFRLSQHADHCEIYVQDSGCGLPLDKLLEKGLTQGILRSPARDDEIAQLIFRTGLSTAEKVTEVSGRGVGMDAVKSMVEELGGKILIQFSAPKSADGFRPFGILLQFPLTFVRPV